MTISQLIRELEDHSKHNPEAQCVFRASFEINLSTSESDEGKHIDLTFADIHIGSSHPNRVFICLC